MNIQMNRQNPITLFNISNPAYIKKVDSLYTKKNLNSIKEYMLVGYILENIEFLDKKAFDVAIETDNMITGASFEIIDLLGQTVFTGKLQANKTEVNIQKLPNGLYMFRTGTGEAMNFMKLD